ncbi:GspE/PulE family protein [Myxococcaceae bacterium GXIMD 01537]
MPRHDAPFAELAQFELDRHSIRLLPEPFCRRNLVVVLGRVASSEENGPVTVGMLEPEDELLRQRLADFLQRPLRPVRLNRFEVETALEAGFGAGLKVSADLVIRPSPLQSRPTAVEMVDHILSSSVARKASDIHIESYADDVDLRFRIDGILHQAYTDMDPVTVAEVVSRIKVLAQLDITERRRPQDGRIRAVIEHGDDERKVVDYRVSVVPSPSGEDVVVRILDASVGLVPVGKLGMRPELETLFLQLLSNPEGLVLVTGPTGSGKTTTLYSALAQLNDGRRKIITAEDPIEYFIPKVNQKQVSGQMSHALLLRALLRQDPNVMLVGEIRDLETGSMALSAASTGHMVLGTLHTADAVGAVGRLRGLKLDDTELADALLAVLAQRLVRRVCARCVQPAEPTREQRELLGRLLEGVEPKMGRGCEECHHTGYRGRTGIYELLMVDAELQTLIASGAHNARLRASARERGFRTLVEDALDKVSQGLTTLAELVRVVPYRHLLAVRDEKRA